MFLSYLFICLVLGLVQGASIQVQTNEGTEDEPCDGTLCPGGCCPEYNWFCCPDMYPGCARTEQECPFLDSVKALIKVASVKFPCDGTACEAGCCYQQYDWFCCTDVLCVPTPADCAVESAGQNLIKMAASGVQRVGSSEAKEPCEGTDCPGGCCPEVDWFCCVEYYCAPTPEDCVSILGDIKNKMELMSMNK